jgi:hypothetical protein
VADIDNVLVDTSTMLALNGWPGTRVVERQRFDPDRDLVTGAIEARRPSVTKSRDSDSPTRSSMLSTSGYGWRTGPGGGRGSGTRRRRSLCHP